MPSIHTVRKIIIRNPGFTTAEIYRNLPKDEKGRDGPERRANYSNMTAIVSRLHKKGEVRIEKNHPTNRWFPTDCMRIEP